MPETFAEIQDDQISRTIMTDRELLIHLTQHAEWQTAEITVLREQVSEMHALLIMLQAELEPFRPLLAKLAPGGKPDFLAVMQTRREAKRNG